MSLTKIAEGIDVRRKMQTNRLALSTVGDQHFPMLQQGQNTTDFRFGDRLQLRDGVRITNSHNHVD